MNTTHFAARYVSLFFMLFIFCINGIFFAWIATSIPRPPAKRAAAYSFVNAVGNSASTWTPFTYRDADSPYYRPALGLNIGLLTITALCCCYLRWDFARANKRIERLENDDVPLSDKDMKSLRKAAKEEGVDIETAKRLQRGYRYVI